MKLLPSIRFGLVCLAATGSLSLINVASAQSGSKTVAVAKETAMAKDFRLQAVAGQLKGEVQLSEVNKDGPVVLVVLRGYPGYQCGICSRQVGALIAKADQFAAKNAKVLMIYPGPASKLDQRAAEFLKGSTLPAPFTLLVDPDYKFTNDYKLRWSAPRETAYPSTFVIDANGEIAFSKISKTHGGRTKPTEILSQL